MKRLLNTLYILSSGTCLSRKGETVLVTVEHQEKVRIPIHTLDGIICFGHIHCSPSLMELCAERNVTITFLNEYGKFVARVHGPVSGNVLLRREQYRRADDLGFISRISRNIILGKIANSRTVLLRAMRDHEGKINTEKISAAAERLLRIAKNLRNEISVDTARGYEGEASRIYFSVFDHLILTNKEHFCFIERSRRPPMDNINALLSFLYAILMHDVISALEGVGLDPAVGFLHRDRPGRPGLALDLMEELRPFIADRLVLSLVNRKQVNAKGFKKTETGAVIMEDETRRELLAAYQKRKREEITHPFIKEKIPIGLIPHVQALLLSRYLRGDLQEYPPFIWR